jgi:DNA-binding CsgD family transcriptional regulator
VSRDAADAEAAIGIADQLATTAAEMSDLLRKAYEREGVMLELLPEAGTILSQLLEEVRRARAGLRAGPAKKVSLADAAAVEARLLKATGLSLSQIAARQGCDRSTARRRLRRPLKL